MYKINPFLLCEEWVDFFIHAKFVKVQHNISKGLRGVIYGY